jgi:lysozyme
MKTSNNGLSIIKHFEGLKLEAYLCPAKVVTIGYGTTRINGKPINLGTKITVEEAERLLKEDLKAFEAAVTRHTTVELNQNQFDALVSFVYNVGEGNFRSSTLLKLLNSGNYEGASEQLLRWTRANGQVLPGLVRRREAEKRLFDTPIRVEEPKTKPEEVAEQPSKRRRWLRR